MTVFGTVLRLFGTVLRLFGTVWHCSALFGTVIDLRYRPQGTSDIDLREPQISTSGYGCLGQLYTGAWDSCIRVPGMGYTMGWALAIPMGYAGVLPTHYPGYTPHRTPRTAPAGYTLQPAAQRLADSVKTVISGCPIYREVD